MSKFTRRSALRGSAGLLATGAIGCPHIALKRAEAIFAKYPIAEG